MSGELFFGGINGFNIFHPKQLFDNSTIPEVMLTDFRINHQPVEIGSDRPIAQHINLRPTITLCSARTAFSLFALPP